MLVGYGFLASPARTGRAAPSKATKRKSSQCDCLDCLSVHLMFSFTVPLKMQIQSMAPNL
jgi:hypothetical protein